MSENNGQFKIDKDIPLPPRSYRGGIQYPWYQLEVGHSFFVPGKTTKGFSAGANSAAKRTGKEVRFACRTVIENGVKGVRVWRVA